MVDARCHENKVINVSLVVSCEPCQFRHQRNTSSCQFRVNLRWSYIKYNNFCIKGKIITRVGYIKKLPCKAYTCTLGWRMKRKLNDEIILNVVMKKNYWIFYINRNILTTQLIHYIDFNSLLHHVINLNWPSSSKELQIWPIMWNTQLFMWINNIYGLLI